MVAKHDGVRCIIPESLSDGYLWPSPFHGDECFHPAACGRHGGIGGVALQHGAGQVVFPCICPGYLNVAKHGAAMGTARVILDVSIIIGPRASVCPHQAMVQPGSNGQLL